MNIKTIIFGTLLILLIGGSISYFVWGRPTPSPTPTPSPVLSPTISVPSSTPQSTIKPTPTPKLPTATPISSPKPTVVVATPTPASVTIIQPSTPHLDGFRASNNGGNDSAEIRIGRNINLTMRGFVSFDVPATLSGKTVSSVFLRLYQYQVTGSPYSVGGNLLVEHMDYGSTLGSEDYDASVFDSASATMGASNPTIEWKDIDVTSAFKNDLAAGHSRSQYRLRFAAETIGGTDTGDFSYFYSSNSGSNSSPPSW